MKSLLQKFLAAWRLPALYTTLFPIYFGIGWGLDRLPVILSRPLAFVLLLYVPALLMLMKTRSRAESFTLATMQEGVILLAIFAAIYLIEEFTHVAQSSPFLMIYPLLLCVKTLTTFREKAPRAALPAATPPAPVEDKTEEIEEREKEEVAP